jgi:molybdopterin-guanine dinucleotide biosynthesis protein A
VDDLAGFVLAGGSSTRMGRDKAFLELGGRSLLDRMLSELRSLTSDVRIVGPAERFSGYSQVVEDMYRGHCPLAGIHAALTATTKALNLMVAVDLPRVTRALLTYIVEQARASSSEVTVPRAGGFLQPLCAVYRRSFAALAAEELELGHNKIDVIFQRCSVRVIDEEELHRAGFGASSFSNVNTPVELDEARQQLE